MRSDLYHIILLLVMLLASCRSSGPASKIAGVVRDENGPVSGAIVRVKATAEFTTTDENGRFVLTSLHPEDSVILTAWAEGYYIGGGEEKYIAGTTDVQITLKKHASQDNSNYQWLSAFAKEGKEANCENCHFDPANPSSALPFNEWHTDAHALSTQNTRFLSMYLGQDVNGNQSPPREYGSNRDYGRIPLRPVMTESYFGPGYKLDFPETAGNCAACHAPAAATNAAYETDPTFVTGAGTEGVTCDFCHKVWDVLLDPTSGLPQQNMPGVLSFEFRRPSAGHQFFAGPFDDVAPGEDTYTPIQQQSQFCAPCHFGSFWGTQIYNSFGEWLASPYSDAKTGKTCQDCHMPSGQNDHFARIEKGGEIRDPQTIFSHRMPGAADQSLLQNALTMTVDVHRANNEIVVDVNLLNDQTGHHIPTDSPLRQMLLLVNTTDENGQPLTLLEGGRIPEWGGVGDPDLEYYSGLPGKGFAKILSELWTELEPVGSYWNPTRIVSDNRIPAFASDSSTYVFAAPAEGGAKINITLLLRRAFKELMDQKGWDAPDIVMEQEVIQVP